MKNLNNRWLKAAALRSIRTMAQTALGMFTIGAAMNEVKWTYVISVSIVAGIYSLLTSIAGLPEVEAGDLLIDTHGDTDIYRLELDGDVADLKNKKNVTFGVKSGVDLSQQ